MERRFVNSKELAVYLGLSPNTIKVWVYQKRLPFKRFGRLIKFDIREIDKTIAESEVI